MDSDFILKAIRRHHPRAAIVPEITIEDHDMPDRDQQVECEAFLQRRRAGRSPDPHRREDRSAPIRRAQPRRRSTGPDRQSTPTGQVR